MSASYRADKVTFDKSSGHVMQIERSMHYEQYPRLLSVCHLAVNIGTYVNKFLFTLVDAIGRIKVTLSITMVYRRVISTRI